MATILIAEPDRQLSRALRDQLVRLGHRIEEAASGEEAQQQLHAHDPDLMLLNENLPGAGRLGTIHQLRAQRPHLEVVRIASSVAAGETADSHAVLPLVARPQSELLLTIERALRYKQAPWVSDEIVAASDEMQAVFRQMTRVLGVDVTVLITGESGTGKELVARAIHRRSRRANSPFVPVNCSAIPATLVEAEFFGHEKGAFTDARARRPGRFEMADGGILFLDEIGDLAPEAQAKILRALQDKEILPLGASAARPIDVRVLAATNQNLREAVQGGRFREDLYWRLDVVHIHLPPLRKRRGDLALLAEHFLARFNRELGLDIEAIGPEARALIELYPWPGNARELENVICRAMILCEGRVLTVSDLPSRFRDGAASLLAMPAEPSSRLTLTQAVERATERVEKTMILSRLAEHLGNRTTTAKSLGVSRKTLFNKMHHYGLAGSHAGRETPAPGSAIPNTE
jgi:two-component system response regulator AtoC